MNIIVVVAKGKVLLPDAYKIFFILTSSFYIDKRIETPRRKSLGVFILLIIQFKILFSFVYNPYRGQSAPQRSFRFYTFY